MLGHTICYTIQLKRDCVVAYISSATGQQFLFLSPPVLAHWLYAEPMPRICRACTFSCGPFCCRLSSSSSSFEFFFFFSLQERGGKEIRDEEGGLGKTTTRIRKNRKIVAFLFLFGESGALLIKSPSRFELTHHLLLNPIQQNNKKQKTKNKQTNKKGK